MNGGLNACLSTGAFDHDIRLTAQRLDNLFRCTRRIQSLHVHHVVNTTRLCEFQTLLVDV